jgi:hypothetical protein
MKAVVIVTALLLMARVTLSKTMVWLILLGAIAVFVVILGTFFHRLGFDYRIFWAVGRDVWGGRDPYSDEFFGEHPFLHPPSALPLFALFAVLPFDASVVVWTLLNAVAALLLVPFAYHAVKVQAELIPPASSERPVSWHLPGPTVVGLTAAFLLSDACLGTLYLGQLSLLTAALLIGALLAQGRGRAIGAGLCLAAATVKVGTMLPFLLLLARKRDLLTWAALAVAALGLTLATVSPAALPGRLVTITERIKQLEAPGVVNDYSFEGPRSENMLGFDHAFYRLGLRDRGVIRLCQYATLLLLGAWVAREVLLPGRLPRAAACSLVAFYATVFLYHRTYDAVLLGLPLAYSAAQAQAASGVARCLFTACVLSILMVLYTNIELLGKIQRLSLGWGAWGRLVQATVLPYPTWLIVIAMACLVAGSRKLSGPHAAVAPA